MTSFYNSDNNTIDNFYDKGYSEIDNRSEIIEDVLKINNQGTQLKDKADDKNKLTHKDCLLLYLNPNIGSKNKLELAMRHVQGCNICKKEISKKKIQDNISLSEMSKSEKKSNKEKNNEKLIQPFIQLQQPPVSNSDKNDDYKKMLLDEKNIQYQNILIENTMSKFLENNDEKKKLNENIEKILQYLLKKDIQENSTLKNNYNGQNYNGQNYNGQNYNQSSNDFTIIYICLTILIILLIVDIILRIR